MCIKVGSGPFSVTAFHDGIDGLRLDYLEVPIPMVVKLMALPEKISVGVV